MAQAIMDKFTKNVFKEKSIIDPNKKLRAAVVGIGWIAEAQVDVYKRQKLASRIFEVFALPERFDSS